MNLKDFNAVEKKYDLPNLSLNGYFYWNYFRTVLGWEIEKQNSKLDIRSGVEKVNLTQKIVKKINRIINILFHGRVKKEECDILVLNHERRVWNDKAYECIYTDEITKKYKKSIVLETPYQGGHYKPVETKRIIYTDIVEIYSYILCSICRLMQPKKFNAYKQKMSESLRIPIAELNEKYDSNVKIEELETTLIYGYYMYKVEKAYYSSVIRKLNPKLIIEVVSYSRKCMVVNEIAAEMGISTIELQHGTIGEEHWDYNYPKGYKIKQFPEYLFLFGDYWKERSSFPISQDKLLAVGYPYMDKMERKYRNMYEKKTKKNILFLSTAPIGLELTNLAVELARMLDLEKYHIIYKLHPVEYTTWRERYPELIHTEIEVIDSNRRSLYEFYAQSDIQISGFNSTTVFEGLYFGLTTFLISPGMAKEFKELCISGIAHEIGDVEDLYRKIIESESLNKCDSDGLGLWKKDGLNNMIKEIDKILERETDKE